MPSATERLHPDAERLDRLSARELVRLLHREDLVAVRAVGAVHDRIARASGWAADALARGGRLIYLGAGTSGRLGVLDAAECPPTFGTRPDQVLAIIAGGPKALLRAVEGAEDDAAAGARELVRRKVGPRDLVVGISASGTTPFVIGALGEARRAKARTMLLSCAPGVRSARVSLRIDLDTGPELIAGSTRLKAGTATKLVLNALSTAAMVRLGRTHRGRMIDLAPTNAKLRARALGLVLALTGLRPPAARKLLERAGGQVRLALAMHATGSAPAGAAERLAREGLAGERTRAPRREAR